MAITSFAPHGLADRLLAGLLRKTLQWGLKPVFSPRVAIPFQRRWLALMSRLTLAPRGLVFEPTRVGGVPGEWVRERAWASLPGAAPRRGTLLYLHGGAYCVGSPATHRAITGRLARLSGMAVLSLDYRLAPEHRFPAAVDDAVAACLELAARGPLVVGGDSAGGGLALATALALRDAGQALPAGLLLFSPWVDLSLSKAPSRPPAGEAMLSKAWAAACAAHLLGDTPATDSGASPLRADLRGLPPVLIQAGTDELLYPEALRLHDALAAAGGAVDCQITPGRWHVFQMHGGALRSADQALERAADFVAATVDHIEVAASAAAAPITEHEVLILGAGMSGLCMAIQLLAAGQRDFVVLEQSAGLGGTWWDNRYPGAHVDVPAPLYSFSFAPNPAWQRRFASAPEIQAYMQRCARRFGVLPHVRFGRRIVDARFDEARGRWLITEASGARHSARFFVCSTGPLSQARLPDIEGLADFQGELLHSARWDPAAALAGRRVAVIGTGSTASQLVPPIAEQAAQLHVFQRTANWVMPRMDRRYRAVDRALAHLPPYSALVRGFWYLVLEWGRRGFDEGTLARRALLASAAHHLRQQVPDAALRARLQPPYPLGCKRIIYSNDYLRTMTRPNVELVTEGITRFTAHGIVTADGRERAIDTLVCATGFDTVHLLSSLNVSGVGGRTLREAWVNGPEAYHGITVAGFPNLFLMLGPNTGTGHTSTLLYIEPEVRYAIACMQAVTARQGRWLALRPEVMAAHNAALQQRLQGSVWTTCRSWYRMDNGKVVALFPGFTREYRRAVARPDWADYQFG